MKILVTGHKGIVGTFFTDNYGDDYDIVGYDLADGDDLLKFDALKKKMEDCEQVVHLAAIPKPLEEKSFDDYFNTNVVATKNIFQAADELDVKRVIYASSTTIYGIEQGIPFEAKKYACQPSCSCKSKHVGPDQGPCNCAAIHENQPFVSQYLSADDLSCRECDLSYHMSKVMAEQVAAWYGLNKKVESVALRFGPVNKVFLGTSVGGKNAAQAIHKAIQCPDELWYEAFSIVDDISHVSNQKAKDILDYTPEFVDYDKKQIRSEFEDRTRLK